MQNKSDPFQPGDGDSLQPQTRMCISCTTVSKVQPFLSPNHHQFSFQHSRLLLVPIVHKQLIAAKKFLLCIYFLLPSETSRKLMNIAMMSSATLNEPAAIALQISVLEEALAEKKYLLCVAQEKNDKKKQVLGGASDTAATEKESVGDRVCNTQTREYFRLHQFFRIAFCVSRHPYSYLSRFRSTSRRDTGSLMSTKDFLMRPLGLCSSFEMRFLNVLSFRVSFFCLS
jgi:hypothetical protein